MQQEVWIVLVVAFILIGFALFQGSITGKAIQEGQCYIINKEKNCFHYSYSYEELQQRETDDILVQCFLGGHVPPEKC